MSLNPVNLFISAIILTLLAIGILVIWSSSPDLALQQGIFAAVGFVIFILVSRFDYRDLKGFVKPLYFIQLFLLIFVLILGIETRGSTRWISIGSINLQPSELTKPFLILFLAYFWSTHIPNWRNIFKSILWITPPLLLIFKQPDLGTALTILVLSLGLLFASGISFKKISILGIIFFLMLPAVWFTLHDYQKQRITGFLSPANDPLGVGYNVIQSTIAVGSGQIFGRGLGHGTQSRLQFLPEYRTDFIFASIAEELGFVGAGLIILIYIFLISYSLMVAYYAYDFFGSLLVYGVVSLLLFQTVVNIGMTIGLLPVTGITLPLVSYGGSSLVATFISLGLVCSVAKYRRAHSIDIQTYQE